jgi:rod shape-determining protein MreD
MQMLATQRLMKRDIMQRINLKLLYTSLAVALICQMLPWSGLALLIRPDFVLLTVIFWVLRVPKVCNIGTAWFAGLVIDLISGDVFGQNAMAYAITAFFAVIYQRRLILFTVWQQTTYVFLLLVLNQTTLSLLKLMSGGEFPGWIYFAPCITGIIIWLFIAFTNYGLHAHPNKN